MCVWCVVVEGVCVCVGWGSGGCVCVWVGVVEGMCGWGWG